MNYKKYLVIFALFALALSAHPANAAEMTIGGNAKDDTLVSVHEQKIGSAALYVLTYTLRAFGGDMYIPATAERESDGKKLFVSGAGYKILNGDLNPYTGGATFPVLLSTSTLSANGEYIIPDGEKRQFTLFVLLNNTNGAHDEYRLSLTRTGFKTSADATKLESDDVSARKYWTGETSL